MFPEDFTWDEEKRRINIQKHGIDFLDIISGFDTFLYHKKSEKNGEERHLAIGSMRGIFITVVYTIRGKCGTLYLCKKG